MNDLEKNTHDDIRDLIPAYAIGATDPEETARVESHLRECSECRALLEEYQRLADEILYTVPLVAAPPSLEERLMAQVQEVRPVPVQRASPETGGKSHARFLFPRLRAWATVAAVILLLLSNAFWMARTQKIEQEFSAQATALAFLVDAPEVPLTGDAVTDARGVLVLRPDTNVAILHLDHLPPLPEGKAYQVWLIRNGQRDSAAVFRPSETKEITLVIRAPRPLGEYEALGITIEPAGGSPGPTGPRVIKGELRKASRQGVKHTPA